MNSIAQFLSSHWVTISAIIGTILAEISLRNKPGAVPPSKWPGTFLDQIIKDKQ